MARWKLTAPHYLNVEGTEWEYKEVDRTTGKEVRRRYSVPRLIHPDDPSDWTEKVFGLNGQAVDGSVVVSDGNGASGSDIIFSGDPTPDMIPLDDAARAISEGFAGKWKHPIDSLSGTFADGLVDRMQAEMSRLQSQQSAPKIEGLQELLAAIGGMMKQNQEIIGALADKRRA